jgi:hypothetical protein
MLGSSVVVDMVVLCPGCRRCGLRQANWGLWGPVEALTHSIPTAPAGHSASNRVPWQAGRQARKTCFCSKLEVCLCSEKPRRQSACQFIPDRSRATELPGEDYCAPWGRSFSCQQLLVDMPNWSCSPFPDPRSRVKVRAVLLEEAVTMSSSFISFPAPESHHRAQRCLFRTLHPREPA